jgi:hypothetical protein
MGLGTQSIPGVVHHRYPPPFDLGPGRAVNQYYFALVKALHQGVIPIHNRILIPQYIYYI